MSAPQAIIDLVERFKEQAEFYKSNNYKEASLRKEFLDPFFAALGWDMENKAGASEAYKAVYIEYPLKIQGATKSVDYCFRIGSTPKFFVEAKRPSVNINEDMDAAYQLRRYAWNAHIPIAILTDFEEFSVYDMHIKPLRGDKANKGRVYHKRFTDYEAEWETIYSRFSSNAVLKGLFDQYAEKSKGKRGTVEVDDDFLLTIEKWRNDLARNIALRNTLTQRELNFSVQRIIDRIIFLRICEDRGIEDPNRLQGLVNGNDIYKRLGALFREADARYNSGLFHFKAEHGTVEPPDELTLNLAIDDKLLRDILKSLYYPESDYEFGLFPADVLGHVYEQFLGKVIRLTDGQHRVVVEQKPEVRKAKGVYYTPTYIVDYIVKETVGKLTEGKTPDEIAKLRILDPACGSGSFLIGAYQYLLDRHLAWYLENDPEGKAKGKKQILVRTSEGWKLTIAERKRILLNNIYGVDIDSQAVEVTKLSLLLKVLEGETEQSVQTMMNLFRERALPDLGSNIKCGNSLIGPDFYAQAALPDMNDEERLRVNVFDWQAEFPAIFKAGGFDAVIGNPPYSYMISAMEQRYFSDHYKHQDYQKDLYLLFLERYHYLLADKGLLGVIISNTWLQSVTLRKIRCYLATHYTWENILHLPEKVFRAVVDTHVLIFRKGVPQKGASKPLQVFIRTGGKFLLSHELARENIPQNGDPINVVASDRAQELYKKIVCRTQPLKTFCNVFNGVKPFEKGKGTPPQTEQTMKEKPFVHEGSAPDASWVPLLRGSLIHRYKIFWQKDYWIKYGPWLAAPRDPAIFDAPIKIMVRQTGDSIIATLIDVGFVARNNLHILLPKTKNYDLKYFLGLLNSKLMDFFYAFINPEKGEALAEVKKHHVEGLPIHPIDFSEVYSKESYKKMIELVDRMLKLSKQQSRTPQEKTVLDRQIAATDVQIDRLVYDLYGLTEEEIKIVEGE